MDQIAANDLAAIGSDGFEKGASEKDADQMALVFGAAFVVIDQIGTLGNLRRGFGQAFFNFRPRAREQCLSLE
jgi:hypothetical protein